MLSMNTVVPEDLTMLKFLNTNRLLIGVLMGAILIVVGGGYYLEHLENEKALEKERNLRLDYPQWHLPEGAKARIGTGTIHTMQYSPDDNLLAVVSSIGVWILDAQTAELKHLLAAHSGVINSISFSPDSRTLAVGTENGEAQLWDTSSGEHKKTFSRRDYFYGVDTVFIMPNGRTLVVVYSSRVDLWDITTGLRKNTLSTDENQTPTETVNNLPNMYMSLGGRKNSFSSDGKTVASGSGNDSFRFWDFATRKEIKTLKAEPSGGYGELLSFSSDLRTLAIANYSQKRFDRIWEINLWDVNTQTKKKIIETETFFGIPFLVFSPDGNFIASHIDEAIRIWDVNTGKEKKKFKGHEITGATVAFSTDNRTLVSASYDMLRFWDIDTGKVKKTKAGYGASFRNVSLSQDAQTLTSICSRSFRLWNLKTGKHQKNLIEHEKYFWNSILSPDGRKIASSAYQKNTIHLWDINTDSLSKLKGPSRYLSGIAFSRDSQMLASWGGVGRKNIVQLYNADTGDLLRTLQLTYEDRFPISAGIYFDKKVLAGIGIFEPDLFVWNLVTGDYRIVNLGKTDIIVARFSPDGQVLASVFKTQSQQKPKMDRKIVLHDVKTGEHIRTLTGHTDRIECLTFSPDGRTLASGGGSIWTEKTIRLWDIETGSSRAFTDPDWTERQHKFEAEAASSLAFSPDGQTLVSGMKLGDILLWETATGGIKKTLHGHSGRVSQMVYSADGRTLISVSDDGTILIWDVTTI